MMRLSLAMILVSLLGIVGCDLTGGSAKVQRQADGQLRQYFRDAHAIVSPQLGIIFAVTCTRGLGKAAVQEIARNLEKKRAIQRLEQARHLPLKLSPYRFFVLEFDEYCIWLDADAKQHWILPADPQSQLRYKEVCSDSILTRRTGQQLAATMRTRSD